MAAYACSADGPTPLFCLVRDLSPTGARLAFIDGATFPDIFDLHISGRDRAYQAKIIWRRSEEVGVRFLAKISTPDVLALSRAS